MSAASNRPPRSNSLLKETDAREIARRVAALEAAWPLEVRVVVSTRGGHYGLGAIRMLTLLFVVVEFVTWGLWGAVPSWAFHALILGLLFLGGDGLGLLPFSRFFTSRGEREQSVERRAHLAFNAHGVSRTTDRNGLLLFVSLPERMFYLLPDTSLARIVPQEKWQSSVDGLRQALAAAPTGGALPAAVFHLLSELEDIARESLVARAPDAARNELPDVVIFEDETL